MYLSENFSLREFLKSDKASRMGKNLAHDLTNFNVDELQRLCETVLQPLRDELQKAMGKEHMFIISSGFRPEWLNQMVGGSSTSAHVFGRAADFTVTKMSNFDVCTFVAERIARYPIDQLIYEFGDWVHIGLAPHSKEPRRQILTAVYDPAVGKTKYLQGLVKQKED